MVRATRHEKPRNLSCVPVNVLTNSKNIMREIELISIQKLNQVQGHSVAMASRYIHISVHHLVVNAVLFGQRNGCLCNLSNQFLLSPICFKVNHLIPQC